MQNIIKNNFIGLLKFLRLHSAFRKVRKVFINLMVNYSRNHFRKNKMIRFYSFFINKQDLCFDVGANIGNRTEIFLKLGARVVAIEPQLTCFNVLLKKYHENHKVILVQKALGEIEGEAELMISNSNTLSSLSKDWIAAVTSSKRFYQNDWNKKENILVTTLDSLINKCGLPKFIKIDVEGYEYNVIKGLSQPVKYISLEFTPEFIHSTIECVKHLSTIGMEEFNYSIGESMELSLVSWVNAENICDILLSLNNCNYSAKIF